MFQTELWAASTLLIKTSLARRTLGQNCARYSKVLRKAQSGEENWTKQSSCLCSGGGAYRREPSLRLAGCEIRLSSDMELDVAVF